jgi:hypothetical protein
MVVGEVVEHIVLADGLLFDTATKSLTRHADARWDATLSKTETPRRALPDRSRPVDAPWRDSTAGRNAAPGAAVTLHRSAWRVLKYARGIDAPLKAPTAANPFFGSVLG